MPDDPLAWAREQAARVEPAVHAAAMLWIARVQTALDSGHARITFEMALEETRRRSGRDCEKRRFYEKVALVKGDLRFFSLGICFWFWFRLRRMLFSTVFLYALFVSLWLGAG